MANDEALRRYRKGHFTDNDIVSGTGLTVRAWRELIKIGAVQTVTQGRGPGCVRLCDTTTFKRSAVIAAINSTGLSLATAGQIAYFLPFEEFLFAGWDPFPVLFLDLADDNPDTGLPPRRSPPRENWFDPDTPATADPHDCLITIYEARFIGVTYKTAGKPDPQPFIYADLRNQGKSLVLWLPFHGQRPVFDPAQKGFVDSPSAKWDPPSAWSDRLNPGFLNYRYEERAKDDPLRLAAEATVRSPLFETTINITLAIRKALRRYLGIEPTPEKKNVDEAISNA